MNGTANEARRVSNLWLHGKARLQARGFSRGHHELRLVGREQDSLQ